MVSLDSEIGRADCYVVFQPSECVPVLYHRKGQNFRGACHECRHYESLKF